MNRVRVVCGALFCAVVLLSSLVAGAPPARAADGTASWVSAPAEPPAPPTGAQPSPFPLPIGYVGDIEFWAPNRGLLITAGNAVVPAGLFAYDGVNWHQLSTVCGGTDGRIAWAGPDEFWTISDQRQGQVLATTGTGAFQDISLCHFSGGQVVASYAMPLEQPNSYKPMNAAACASPSDCWFGGDLDTSGAFHLHWDGNALGVVDAPQDHQIASMTVDDGQIFESVQLAPGDSYGSEDPSHPPLLHVIAPQDSTDPFHSLFLPDGQNPSCGSFCPSLPEYGKGADGNDVAPVTLGGLSLSSDWRAGVPDPQLWAAAGPDTDVPPAGTGTAAPIVLRYADGTWTQVVPNLVSLPGDDAPLGLQNATPAAESVAAEPDLSAAWIAVVSPGNPDDEAHVDRIELNGDGTASVTDQDALGTAQGVGSKGPASAIACPAARDCWLATQEGWLFHLTDGTQFQQDTDTSFASVITFRPADNGVPTVIADEGVADSPPPPPPVTATPPMTVKPKQRTKKAKPLVSRIGRSRLIHRTTLELSFTLTARAHVRLVARRHGAIVAQSPRRTMGAGRRTLRIRLDVRRWPTKLSLNATPVNGGSSSGGGGGGGSGGGVVTT